MLYELAVELYKCVAVGVLDRTLKNTFYRSKGQESIVLTSSYELKTYSSISLIINNVGKLRYNEKKT